MNDEIVVLELEMIQITNPPESGFCFFRWRG